MKETHACTLATIACSPTATPRARLIAIRRLCRLLSQEREALYDELLALRRQANKLRAFLPFTADRVADLEWQVAVVGDDLDDIELRLANIGRVLMIDGKRMTKAIGFDGLCDLLNINPAHRAVARRAGHSTIAKLANACLEDSADRHDEAWKDRPLFNAFHAAR
ncbi:hypothetical protein HA520_05975 [Azotobacter chroococcum]|uniref:Uncharacterized protein n=1 Tax=Azotobacter chroococcum TaxID=353 RepID=A0A4U1KV08_9GAMM|nr:hypothetical protein [Azotobacter chroococcum]NHN76835.1 hypothetical protein [Azotobacter chroococcum]TKD44222.1 hypothetical protein FCG41_07460 [Azotobacter chroococcum]